MIPFLGAGASQRLPAPGTASPPTVGDLARHLADKTDFPERDPELGLATVAQHFHIVGGRDALNRELHDIFDRDFTGSSLHAYLARASRSRR